MCIENSPILKIPIYHQSAYEELWMSMLKKYSIFEKLRTPHFNYRYGNILKIS